MYPSDHEPPKPDEVLAVPGSSGTYLALLIQQHITTLRAGAVLEVRSERSSGSGFNCTHGREGRGAQLLIEE